MTTRLHRKVEPIISKRACFEENLFYSAFDSAIVNTYIAFILLVFSIEVTSFIPNGQGSGIGNSAGEPEEEKGEIENSLIHNQSNSQIPSH